MDEKVFNKIMSNVGKKYSDVVKVENKEEQNTKKTEKPVQKLNKHNQDTEHIYNKNEKLFIDEYENMPIDRKKNIIMASSNIRMLSTMLKYEQDARIRNIINEKIKSLK